MRQSDLTADLVPAVRQRAGEMGKMATAVVVDKCAEFRPRADRSLATGPWRRRPSPNPLGWRTRRSPASPCWLRTACRWRFRRSASRRPGNRGRDRKAPNMSVLLARSPTERMPPQGRSGTRMQANAAGSCTSPKPIGAACPRRERAYLGPVSDGAWGQRVRGKREFLVVRRRTARIIQPPPGRRAIRASAARRSRPRPPRRPAGGSNRGSAAAKTSARDQQRDFGADQRHRVAALARRASR